MCGIFGAISISGFFDCSAFDLFVKLTDLVRYRGPDVSSYMAINLKEQTVDHKSKFDVFLGHRRLSIIDLSERANQPLTDGTGIWIMCNGEIFNYIELKSELKEKGHIFKTETDTEVILKVYREYGDEGFEKLNGMWAFAIVDLPNRKVILSRDRFSIKPLYFTRIKDELYFASEIKQLLPFLKQKEINQNVMFAYLNQGLLDYNEETFYCGIEKLKPKTNLIIQFDTKEIKEKKYWDYTPEEKLCLEDTIERFRELFIDSVKIRLRSDVKVGALLSGGLDSSTIAVIANKLQNGNLETYSVIAKDQKYSEERFVDILSSHKGIRNHRLYFEVSYILDNLPDIIYHNDEPFGSFSSIAHYKLLEKIKNETDLKVVLNGQGGDEILMGYLKYFFFNIKNLVGKRHFIEVLREFFLSFIKRTAIWQLNIGEARRYMPFFRNKDNKSFLNITGDIEPIWECRNLVERQILDIDKYSVPNLTHYEDRNSMAYSLEIRLPFLDHRLVNFVLNLPVETKLNGGWTKYILRKAFPELPEAIRWRRDKQGFITPEKLWLKKDFNKLIHKIFNKSMLGEMGIINDKLFLKYYEDFQNGKQIIWYTDISRALIAELWARMFLR